MVAGNLTPRRSGDGGLVGFRTATKNTNAVGRCFMIAGERFSLELVRCFNVLQTQSQAYQGFAARWARSNDPIAEDARGGLSEKDCLNAELKVGGRRPVQLKHEPDDGHGSAARSGE